MRAHVLTEEIHRAMADKGYGGCQIVAQTPDGKVYEIKAVEVEYHEDATEAATFWIKIEEM